MNAWKALSKIFFAVNHSAESERPQVLTNYASERGRGNLLHLSTDGSEGLVTITYTSENTKRAKKLFFFLIR